MKPLFGASALHDRNDAMRYLLVVILFLAFAAPAVAQIGLYIYPDNPDVGCNFVQSFSQQSVYVVVTGAWSGARFALPANCMSVSSVVPMGGTTLSGDLSSGFVLSFAQCTSDRTAVLRLDLIAAGDCCPIGLIAHAGAASGKVELIDCSGHTVPATWTPEAVAVTPSTINCDNPGVSPLPRNEFPPDGATDVPLTIELSWMIDPPISCGSLGDRYANVYFGTGSNLPIIADENTDRTSLPIGPLQPGTTYHWKVWINNYGVPADGSVWTFRTLAPIATEPTTWGRVKSLFR